MQNTGLERDNAERKLQIAKNSGLLIPNEILKSGNQKQYFLSNYKHVIDAKSRDNKDTEIIPDDDITLRLLRVLSDKKYVYHHIHLETNLNYVKDYHLIDWPTPSSKNMQKVKTYKLNPKRKCSFTLSPNGKVNVAIECTLYPFEFHTHQVW